MFKETRKQGNSRAAICHGSFERRAETTETGEEKVKRAHDFAALKHDGNKRLSGEDYICHPEAVEKIIREEMGILSPTIRQAAFLHDVVEDCGVPKEELRDKFGEEVWELVDGVTKLGSGASDKDSSVKMVNMGYFVPAIFLLKLGDRLHNMRTLKFMSQEKQLEKSQETMDLYTRLAGALGLFDIKQELEDLAFQYLDPNGFAETKTMIDNDKRRQSLFTSFIRSSMENVLRENNFEGKVNLRESGYWATYKKRKKWAVDGKSNPHDFSKINDLTSVRVVLPTIDECYRLLSVVDSIHGSRVDQSKFHNYIIDPAINGYRAIQMTVNTEQGPLEIALMTEEMECFNLLGIAWLIHQGEKDLHKYALKLVMTPEGQKGRYLPPEATGFDFAAAISPEMLANAIEMEVNGEVCALSEVLPNGCTVRIITSEVPRREPVAGAESYCLESTQIIIMEQRTLELRYREIEKGRKMLEILLRSRGILTLDDLEQAAQLHILYKLGCSSNGELNFLLATGSMRESELTKALNEEGISKAELRYTTIQLSGVDQKGILSDVSELIVDMGKSVSIVHSRTDETNNYCLRLVIKDLNLEQERGIKEKLESDNRFNECIVV